MGIANPIGGIYHARRPDERVAPPQHRRRPGMRLLAGDRDLVPALTWAPVTAPIGFFAASRIGTCSICASK